MHLLCPESPFLSWKFQLCFITKTSGTASTQEITLSHGGLVSRKYEILYFRVVKKSFLLPTGEIHVILLLMYNSPPLVEGDRE